MPNRIGTVRRQRGLTQAELADRIGLSRTYLSEIEHNKHEVGSWRMYKIASQLGVTVEELIIQEELQNA